MGVSVNECSLVTICEAEYPSERVEMRIPMTNSNDVTKRYKIYHFWGVTFCTVLGWYF